jgi:uncharacterized protein
VAGPLVVPIAELRRRVGTRRPLQRTVDVASIAGLASSGATAGVAGTTIPANGEITLDLVVESVLEGLTVTGELRAPWRAECRRCLEPVEGEVDLEVQELFEATPTPGETYLLDGDHIDLTELVHDAVVLGLPLSVVCSEACEGPDPQRFPATVEGDAAAPLDDEPGEAEPPADPRWAALRELRFEE